MIYLTKGQKLFNNEAMVVYDQTGFYEDGTAVLCASIHNPEEAVCRYEAKYIAYGDQVYIISDESKLVEEITKIDPQTLLGKTSEEVSLNNVVNNIQTVPLENSTEVFNEPAPDTQNTVEQIPVVESTDTVSEPKQVEYPTPTFDIPPAQDPEVINITPTPVPDVVIPSVEGVIPVDTEMTPKDQIISFLNKKGKRKIS